VLWGSRKLLNDRVGGRNEGFPDSPNANDIADAGHGGPCVSCEAASLDELGVRNVAEDDVVGDAAEAALCLRKGEKIWRWLWLSDGMGLGLGSFAEDGVDERWVPRVESPNVPPEPNDEAPR
jgi:hypothetical protein